MQFILIDRILELEPGRRILAVKNLTLAEEYLAEHFPGFPVLPGVLMLEAGAQAAAWLVRITENYQHSVIVLKSVRTVKYGNFVSPGRQLLLEAQIVRQTDRETEFRLKGTVDGLSAVSGRITMERYNLRDRDPALEGLDREIVGALKSRYPLLMRKDVRPAEPLAASPAPADPMVAVDQVVAR